MKTIQIEVISVGNKAHVPTAKGGYNTIEVAYRDDGKVMGKKIVDFANQGLFEQVSEFKQGDALEVDIDKVEGKDGREFWQWQAVRKLSGQTLAQATSVDKSANQAGNSAGAAKTGKVIGSTYETAEERARRQVLIVRQSSLSNAIEYLKVSNGSIEAYDDVITVASKFEEYVYNGQPNQKESKQTGEAASVDSMAALGAISTQQQKRVRRTKGQIEADKQQDDLDKDIPF